MEFGYAKVTCVEIFGFAVLTNPVNAAGNVMVTPAGVSDAPLWAMPYMPQQICVPSAKRMNSPLELLPRCITAPVGTPEACPTEPTMLALLNAVAMKV
ncbi:hypothetical protein D3C79_986080 [compost metagenome]